ncbi:hypothetical protein C4J81_19100 (plasmid) [Deltaproteobacteria bacterium Smac51]|nr:hypothetical protein C4J81_19100 [Deltaproteobacteria bacterium Smac51]
MITKKNTSDDPGLFDGLEQHASPTPPPPKPRSPRRPQKPDGHEVGRLMIRDLIAVHERVAGRNSGGLLSLEERSALVNSLSSAKDVVKYNEMRNIHDYLVRASIMYKLYYKSAETEFWQLLRILEKLDEGLDREIDGIEPAGTAAQKFLGQTGEFSLHIKAYKFFLKEGFVMQEAVAMIGRFIGVLDVVKLVEPEQMLPNRKDNTIHINGLMTSIPPKMPDGKLKEKVFACLTPIIEETLKPSGAAIETASDLVNFTTVQGYEEGIYAILRGDGDNG